MPIPAKSMFFLIIRNKNIEKSGFGMTKGSKSIIYSIGGLTSFYHYIFNQVMDLLLFIIPYLIK